MYLLSTTNMIHVRFVNRLFAKPIVSWSGNRHLKPFSSTLTILLLLTFCLVSSRVESNAEPHLLPCDLPDCVAAHSVTRKLHSEYLGNLFQIQREIDGETLEIGTLSSGEADTSKIASFCSGTKCRFSIIYDQMHTPETGNNLPQTNKDYQAPLSWAVLNRGRVPMVSTTMLPTSESFSDTTPKTYYRNRKKTVNMPVGNEAITEYMVVNTANNSKCCGTYGNMEKKVKDEGRGTMFALAYSKGAAGNYHGSKGPWPGVDWENGVFMYEPPPKAAYLNILAKYNPNSKPTPTWELKVGAATNGLLNKTYSNALPGISSANWKGGLSLGEGGDGTPAPVNFLEGAIFASVTNDADDQAIQKSVMNFYGPPSSEGVLCKPGNLLYSSLNLTNTQPWEKNTSSTLVEAAVDPLGCYTAGKITNNSGDKFSALNQILKLNPDTIYTFTDYVARTIDASVFPAGSVQTNSHGSPEFAWVLNTNTGKIVRGTWGAGVPTSLSSQRFGDWWRVEMKFRTAKGATQGTVFLDPPTSNSQGERSDQSTNGLYTSHYCPKY